MANKKTSNKNKKKLQKQYAKNTASSTAGAYVVGTLGDMIVQSSCGAGNEPEFDPKLASFFSKPVPKAVPVVKTKVVANKEAMPAPPIRQKFNVSSGRDNNRRQNGDGEQLRNKDAASIRVGVKAKFASEPVLNSRQEPKIPSSNKKLKRLQQSSKKRTEDGKKLRHRPREGTATAVQNSPSTPPIDHGVAAKKEKKIKKKEKSAPKQEDEDVDEDGDVDMNSSEATKEEVEDEDGESENPSTTTSKKKNKSGTVGEIKKSLKELNAPKEKDPELEARTLFVGNVPKEAQKKQIRQLFRPFGGTIETIRFRSAAPDKPTTLKKVASNRKELHPDRASIAAYVRFSSREEAQEIMEKAQGEGLALGDHHLVLDLADGSLKRDNKKAIFVGNVPLKTQDNEVWDLFSDCGKIESVRIVRDRDSGLGKGFGYVNFVDRASVELALKMDGADFNNRALRISRCVKKLKKTDNNFSGKPKFNNAPNNRGGKPIRTTPAGGNHTNNNSSSNKDGAKPRKNVKRISQGQRQRKDVEIFGGDRTAEVGKFKKNSKKPNREDVKKVRMAKQLATSTTSSSSSSTNIPVHVKDYKTKKKEMRKMNKPRWPRNK